MSGVTANMQRSVQMMETLNTVMEQYLVDSVRLQLAWHSVGAGATLNVSIVNASRFPIAGIRVCAALVDANVRGGSGASQLHENTQSEYAHTG